MLQRHSPPWVLPFSSLSSLRQEHFLTVLSLVPFCGVRLRSDDHRDRVLRLVTQEPEASLSPGALPNSGLCRVPAATVTNHPSTWWLKTTQSYDLSILEGRSLKTKLLAGPRSFWRLCGPSAFTPSRVQSGLHSLAQGCPPPAKPAVECFPVSLCPATVALSFSASHPPASKDPCDDTGPPG